MTAEKPEAPIVVCPSCGHANLEGLDRCTNCQGDLRSHDVPGVAKPLASGIYLESIEPLVRWDPPVFAGDAPIAAALPQLRAHPGEPIIVLIDKETAAAVTSAGVLRCLSWRPSNGSTVADAVRDVPMMLLDHDSHINSALYRLSTDRLLVAPVKHPSGRLGTVSAVDLLLRLEREAPDDPFFAHELFIIGIAQAVTLPADTVPSRAIEALCSAPDPVVLLLDSHDRLAAALTAPDAFRLLDQDDDGADHPIGSLLSGGLTGLDRTQPVSAALRMFDATGLSTLPVLEGDHAAGILRAVDVLIAYTEAHAEETLNLSPDPEQLMVQEVAGGNGVD